MTMLKREKYNIIGMHCSGCANNVEKTVGALEGVKKVAVDLVKNSMNVIYDTEVLSSEAIISAVEGIGFRADNDENRLKREMALAKRRVIKSASLLLLLMFLIDGASFKIAQKLFNSSAMASVLLAVLQMLITAVILYWNKNYFIVGFKNLWQKSPQMDSLIAVGAGSAFIYSLYGVISIIGGYGSLRQLYFEAGAMIVSIVSFGKYLETRAKNKASSAVSLLLNLMPKTTLVLRNGIEMEIDVDSLNCGDVVVIKPLQNIPVDGTVLEGISLVNEAFLTGESAVVEKVAGSAVRAGTLNGTGILKVKAEKLGEETLLGQIINLVEEASASKAPMVRLADKVSRIFVPVVLVLALLTLLVWLFLGYGFHFAIGKAMAVLVISCPCALGLATPVAIVVGIAKGAKDGILIKSAEVLEKLSGVGAVVLDKTGTMTEAKVVLEDKNIIEGQRKDILQLAASLERYADHPLARSVVRDFRIDDYLKVDNFQNITGCGVSGIINGDNYLFGNKNLMAMNNIAGVDAFGANALYLAKEKSLMAAFTIEDSLKDSSKKAVEYLKAMHLKIAMLTGDNESNAKRIAEGLNLNTEEVRANVLPQDKDKVVDELKVKGYSVLVVGDGINDAPAMARADVAMAIGAGADIALETSNIILVDSDPMGIVDAIKLSRAVVRNIKQNLFWAFFYNALFIPLAAGAFYTTLGWQLSPALAAAAMGMSSLCVVSNSLRLMGFKRIK